MAELSDPAGIYVLPLAASIQDKSDDPSPGGSDAGGG